MLKLGHVYDTVGNISRIDSYLANQSQGESPNRNFSYDQRDRLTRAWSQVYDESYSYDAIGNLTAKAGASMSYGSSGTGTGSGPHQVRNVAGQSYSYDANGNLLSGGGRSYTWTAANMPASVTSGGVTENYTYDGDGNRVARTRNGQTTVYFDGLWDDTLGVNARTLYTFNGQVVAQRDGAGSVTYLHGDHFGSISVVTTSSGAVASRQQFDPWG